MNNSLVITNYKIFLIAVVFFCTIISLCLVMVKPKTTVSTSGNVVSLSTKKIEWGLKRASNHQQPDLGSTNKRIIDSLNGISMGNKDSKKVYLTFDNGYEAGYTSKILDVLKQNNVKATF